jgi:hypothetical protein
MQNQGAGRTTREIIESSSRKKILLLLVGIVTIVLLFNLVAIGYTKPYANSGLDIPGKKWGMLLGLKNPVDWLILGDSTGLVGVDPAIISAGLGGISINLCTSGPNGVINDAWMLDTYITRFGPPRNVLIVNFYKTWYIDPSPGIVAGLPLEWGFWNKLEPPLYFNFGDTCNLWLQRYAPVAMQNPVPRWILEGYWFWSRVFPGLIRPVLRNDGLYQNWDKVPGLVERSTQEEMKFIKEHEFHVSNSAQRALEHIRELADENGFDVYMVDNPIYQGLFADQGFQDYFAKVREMQVGFAATSERIHYLVNLQLSLPEPLMRDAVHALPSGAEDFTRRLVSEIASLQRSSK